MPGGKGDQSRMFSFLRQLSARHDLTLVASGAGFEAQDPSAIAAFAELHLCPTGHTRRAAGAAAALARGRPGQVGWLGAGTWRRARQLSGGHEVVLVNTIRSLGGRLERPVVLDHVDALSLNLGRRARTGPAPVRRVAAEEARRLARYERWAAGWVAAQVVTSAEDAARLPPRPTPCVIPVGWDGPVLDPAAGTRDIDVILTGNMRYPPSARAARRLAEEIVPRLRRQLPDLSAWVVGRDADRLALRNVEVAADVPDLYDYLRRARVAVLPLDGGTGSPYKVLEAAACGAAVVTTPWAARAFGMRAVEAEDSDAFAAAALRLLADETARRAAATTAQAAVREASGAARAARLEAVLLAAAHRREATAAVYTST